MKRQALKRCLYAILPLAAAALAAAGAGYLWSWRTPLDPAALPGTMTLSPESAPEPGRAVTAEVRFELPVRFAVAKLVATPGAGCVVSGEERARAKLGWTRRNWRIGVTLRPLRSGEIPPGKLEVALRKRGGNETEKLLFEIPGFSVGDKAPADKELQLAAPEPVAKAGSKLRWLWLSAILPGALLVWLLLRRRRAARREIPPWERAHAELAALDAGTRGGEVAPERGIGKLTDIVRSYLEARFRLPASSRTTPEFLAGLDSEGTPLGGADRAFLRDFMQEADLVKFARAEASRDALVSAIGKAEILVENTTPHEDGTNDREAER